MFAIFFLLSLVAPSVLALTLSPSLGRSDVEDASLPPEQLHSSSFPLPPVTDVRSSPLPSPRHPAEAEHSLAFAGVMQMDSFRQRAMEQLQPQHGTTTLAFKFQGGVIVAVDSRATMGPTISSQTVKKVIEINPYLLGTMAGGAADCSFWERNLGVQCRMHELEKKRRISVKGAAKLLSNALYGYKGMGLSCGTMIAGWDEQGPHIYFVDDSGSCIAGNRFSVGSGAIYAYGVLDSYYSWELSADDAAKLGRDAIYHATFRDAMSGGTVSVYHITEQGWTKVMGEDVSDLFTKSLDTPSSQ